MLQDSRHVHRDLHHVVVLDRGVGYGLAGTHGRAAATLPSWSPATAFAALPADSSAVASALTFVAVWKRWGAVHQGAGPIVDSSACCVGDDDDALSVDRPCYR